MKIWKCNVENLYGNFNFKRDKNYVIIETGEQIWAVAGLIFNYIGGEEDLYRYGKITEALWLRGMCVILDG